MREFKVGDKGRVVRLLGLDSERGYSVGDISTVVDVVDDGVFLKQRPTRCMTNTQLELVEDNEVSKFKVGDKVRVVKLLGSDAHNGYSVGDVSSIVEVDFASLIYLKKKPTWAMSVDQLELVEEKVVSKFKVGDRVRVTQLLGDDDEYGYSVGDISTVVHIDTHATFPDDFYLEQNPDREMNSDQLELVVEEKAMPKFKVGDKVRVVKLLVEDAEYGYSVGDVSTIMKLDTYETFADDIYLEQNLDRAMNYEQLELVEEEAVPSETPSTLRIESMTCTKTNVYVDRQSDGTFRIEGADTLEGLKAALAMIEVLS
jgi:ribosomal protein L19